MEADTVPRDPSASPPANTPATPGNLTIVVGWNEPVRLKQGPDAGRIDDLADCRDDQIGGNNGFCSLERDATDRVIASCDLADCRDLGTDDMAVVDEKTAQRMMGMENDPFLDCLSDFARERSHPVLWRSIRTVRQCGSGDDMNIGRTGPFQDTGNINGSIAAAVDDHSFATSRRGAEIEPFQQQTETGPRIHRFRALDIPIARLLAARRQENRCEFRAEVVELEIPAEFPVRLKLDTGCDQARDLGVEHVARQAIGWDRPAQHAAGFGVLVEDRDGVAASGEVIGGRQSCRTAADHRYGLAPFAVPAWQRPALSDRLVAEETLDGVDRDRLIDLAAIAAALAGMMADAAGDSRQRVGGDDRFPGKLQPAFLD